MSPSSASPPTLIVASSKASVTDALCEKIVDVANASFNDGDHEGNGTFIVALSGGSLPKLLGHLPNAFKSKGIDPRWNQWHVVLADERCVPVGDNDSNLGALKKEFLSFTEIPPSQVYGIDQNLVQKSPVDTSAIAGHYQQQFLKVRGTCQDDDAIACKSVLVDLAVLGFGPDGHTCSLFPDHKLLEETKLFVAPIDDSPKPPPKRITLTLPVLNQCTKHIIFCGAGESKQPIVKAVFSDYNKVKEQVISCRANNKDSDKSVLLNEAVAMASPPPFPCAIVQPLWSLTWVVDKAAIVGKV
ncbi:MAG: hypothetical protein SGILL_002962 [Bacillariaceae sp.]